MKSVRKQFWAQGINAFVLDIHTKASVLNAPFIQFSMKSSKWNIRNKKKKLQKIGIKLKGDQLSNKETKASTWGVIYGVDARHFKWLSLSKNYVFSCEKCSYCTTGEFSHVADVVIFCHTVWLSNVNIAMQIVVLNHRLLSAFSVFSYQQNCLHEADWQQTLTEAKYFSCHASQE